MKSNLQSATLIIREIIKDKTGKQSAQRRMISYDLSPLEKIIEFGGIDHLINSLRSLYIKVTEASIAAYTKDDKEIFENSYDLIDNLFIIRELANCFEEIKQNSHQVKE